MEQKILLVFSLGPLKLDEQGIFPKHERWKDVAEKTITSHHAEREPRDDDPVEERDKLRSENVVREIPAI